MKVIILAGGFGTRLSEETEFLPKPMIEIGGKPLLWHLMKIFETQGFGHFVVALGFKGEVIKQYFLQYSQVQSDIVVDLGSSTVTIERKYNEDWTIELVDTGTNTMTGGRLKRLRNQLTETFILTYGDGLADIDIGRLVQFHHQHGKLATITAIQPKPRFGLLTLDENQAVQRFSEKPHAREEYINGGFFVLEPAVFDYIAGDATSWEQAPCERLASDGQLMAYRHDGFWQCVDTLHDLRKLRDAWTEGRAGWKVWK